MQVHDSGQHLCKQDQHYIYQAGSPSCNHPNGNRWPALSSGRRDTERARPKAALARKSVNTYVYATSWKFPEILFMRLRFNLPQLYNQVRCSEFASFHLSCNQQVVRRLEMLATPSIQTVRIAAVLVAIFGVSSSAPALTLRLNGGQPSTNMDTPISLQSTVNITCRDDGTSNAGDLFFNDVDATELTTLFSRQTDGPWVIAKMSLDHQGAYNCCVPQAQCEEVAVISE